MNALPTRRPIAWLLAAAVVGSLALRAAADEPSAEPAGSPPAGAPPAGSPAAGSPAAGSLAAEAPDPDAARRAFDVAEVLREEGKWVEAGKAYGQALDADEGAYLTHVRYQQVVTRSGAGAELVAEYDELLKKRPAELAARLHRLRLDPPVARLATLLPLLKATPTEPLLLLEVGRAHLAAGDAPAAKKALESVYATSPRLADVVTLSCEALRRAGDVNGARQRYESILKTRADAYEELLGLARLELAEGKAKEALARAESVLSMRPSFVAAMLVRSEAASRLGQAEDARAALDAALRVNPSHTDAMLASADLTARAGTKAALESAVEAYKKALAVPGVDKLHGLYGLAWAYERLGQFKEASDTYRAAGLVAPTDPMIVNSVGVMLLKQKSFQAALLQFQKAVGLDPKSPEAYLNMAAVAEHQNDLSEALKQYHKVLTMKGHETNLRALVNSAFDYEALGQFKKAEDYIVRVRQLRPTEADYAVFHGDNLFFQKKYKPAIRAYQDAVKLDDKNRFAWRGLGFALSQDGKADDAIEALLKAKALKADDPATLIVLGDLYLADKEDLEKALEHYEAYVRAGGTNPDVPTIIQNIKNALGR